MVSVLVMTLAASPSVKDNAEVSIAVRTGASLTAVTVIFLLTALLLSVPSLVLKLTVLVAVDGLLLLLFK